MCIILFLTLLVSVLIAEYYFLKSHQKVVYIEAESSTALESKEDNAVKTKIVIDEKKQLNTDYHIKNEASENMQLENVFNNIIEQTRVKN